MLRIRNSSILICPLLSCPSKRGRSEYLFIFIQRSPLNPRTQIADERNPTVLKSTSEKRANKEEVSPMEKSGM
jgi:hypothetical protein